ncbi:GNAT family N-acetyltransferase [Alteromonas sp. ASW11-36]|uniref:GNAT family N-acetyltransferase n=1 Tax=Alteromonas arenosi TaxID=3055817 RepID=A0ABT7T1L3_9ALTE|nr:GNAT family N-acetyltransferase [Alteromonas sp. ASW11-36]MDM7862327.1 GNAT family N-acetyltransferase [Alteromonas sp. ASW11-36]
MAKTIEYRVNAPVSVDQFHDVLNASTLGERRPVEDSVCLQGMLANANLIISAWQGATLVGIARSVSDNYYACYLSDLAVSEHAQQQGIGKQLIALTLKQLQPTCKLILIAAPKANEYYRKLGFEHNDRCWVTTP